LRKPWRDTRAQLHVEEPDAHGSDENRVLALGGSTAPFARPLQQLRERDPSTSSRVLVIESDPGYGDLISDALSRAGYSPTLVRSPREAVERMKVSQQDVALIDLADQAKEGVTLALELRRSRADVGLVFMSQSRLGVIESVALYEAGADELIEKPFDPTIFLMQIRAVVRRLSWAEATASTV